MNPNTPVAETINFGVNPIFISGPRTIAGISVVSDTAGELLHISGGLTARNVGGSGNVIVEILVNGRIQDRFRQTLSSDRLFNELPVSTYAPLNVGVNNIEVRMIPSSANIELLPDGGNDGWNRLQATTFNVVDINDAPTVANEIPHQTALVGESFNFQFAEDTFDDADGDSLTYSASLENDQNLPSWLDFTPVTRTFSSNNNPNASQVAIHKVKVTASDGKASVSEIFDIVVANNSVDGSGSEGHQGSNGNDGFAGGNTPDFIRAGRGNDVVGGLAGADRIHGDEGADLLDGGEDNDFISGGTDDDEISGGAGNDFLLGGDGQDSLSGDAGDDVLMGGEGDDILNGGAGADCLSGFGGSDLFVLTAGDPNNIFYDYTDGIDQIGLELSSFTGNTVANVFTNELAIVQSGSSTTISSGADLLATLYNVTADDLTVDDFTAF